MNFTVTNVMQVLFLMAVLTLAGCERKTDPQTAVTSVRTLIKQYLLRLDEQQRQDQNLVKEVMQDDTGTSTNTAAVLEVLEDVASRSIEDLRAFTGKLKDRQHAAQRRQQEAAERLEEEMILLRQRWWRAKWKLQKKKMEADATAQASLEQAEALGAETLGTLAEVERLRRLQASLDAVTEEVRARRQASGREGLIGRWWRRLAGLLRPDATTAKGSDVPLSTTPQASAEIPPVVDDPGEAYTGDNTGPASDAEEPALEDTLVPYDDKAEGSAVTDGADRSEAEDAVPALSDSNAEAPPPLDTNPEGRIPDGGGAAPAEGEGSGTVPQGRRRTLRRFLVVLHTLCSLALAAHRVRARLRRRRLRRGEEGRFLL